MEHRWGQRQKTNVHVFFFAVPKTSGNGRLLNMSCSGAWLETAADLRVYTLLYIQPLEDGEPTGSLTSANVVRRTTRGVGLEWCEKDGIFQRCHLGVTHQGASAIHNAIG
jgi:hypothetical protein